MNTARTALLSTEEVADALGVSIYTVWRWINEGKIRAFKPGKEYRVRDSDLDEFLAAREVRPKVVTGSAHLQGEGTLHAKGRIIRITDEDMRAIIRGAVRGELTEEEAMAAAIEKAET